jgi:hypothetical protein
MSQDTGAARLPGLPVLRTTDQALARWAQAVAEHLEVRSGIRGNPLERAVTVRELTNATKGFSGGSRTASSLQAGEIPIDLGGGNYAALSIDKFSESLRNTKLYKDLVLRLDDTTRFNEVPEAVRNLLLNSIADEAARRGASVSHIENVLQTATSSLAMRIDEVTASVEGSAAGIRELAFAAASMGSASAGKITQVQARLDDVGGVTIEASMLATADRVNGLAGEYMVKVNAGNAVAGVGLSASEDPTGATESAFIIQADQFALMAPVNFSSETTPSATVIGQVWYRPSTKVYSRASATGSGSWASFTPTAPFGVNTTTGQVFINGSLTINSGGGLLQDGTSGAPGQGQVKGVSFIRGTSAPATPTGGSFATPTATGWSDGIPADDNTALWMSTRLFTSDGLTPQQATWTTPAKVGTPSTGSKVQFSIDGSTLWHDTPTTNDYYMRSGTSTDNGVTWTWAGAVKIKGEQGVQGNTGPTGSTGGTGATGTRGSVQRYLNGTSWSDATANASLPSGTPISGDLVTIGSGSFISTKSYNGSAWVAPGVIVDGSLIATGSITAAAMFANTFTGYTFTGSTFQTAASGARIVMSSSNQINIYNASGLVGRIYGGATDGVFFGTANSATVAPIMGYQTGAFAAVLGQNTATGGTAVFGSATGSGGTSAGGSFSSTTGIGVYASGANYAINAVGKIYQANGGTSGQWNNYTNSVLPVANNAFYCGYTGNVWAGIYSQTAVVVTSDARKKTDIENCDLGLDFINSLRPVTYRMIEGHQEATFAPGESAFTLDANGEHVQPTITVRPGSRRHYGLLAQEVKAAIGDLDCGFWTIEDISDADSAQGLRYEELISPMIKAIQQLSARLATLENQP